MLSPILTILHMADLYVISDHKPLVSLFKKSLVDSSLRLTRMLVQLLDYTLDVSYQPGAKMHLSNAISRLSTHDKNEGKTIANLDVSIHAIEELTGFNSLSVDKIHQHTTKDQNNKAHLDLSKTLEQACTCIYWPGITDVIKDSISGSYIFR